MKPLRVAGLLSGLFLMLALFASEGFKVSAKSRSSAGNKWSAHGRSAEWSIEQKNPLANIGIDRLLFEVETEVEPDDFELGQYVANSSISITRHSIDNPGKWVGCVVLGTGLWPRKRPFFLLHEAWLI